jgi:hypothetical protein
VIQLTDGGSMGGRWAWLGFKNLNFNLTHCRYPQDKLQVDPPKRDG